MTIWQGKTDIRNSPAPLRIKTFWTCYLTITEFVHWFVSFQSVSLKTHRLIAWVQEHFLAFIFSYHPTECWRSALVLVVLKFLSYEPKKNAKSLTTHDVSVKKKPCKSWVVVFSCWSISSRGDVCFSMEKAFHEVITLGKVNTK